MAKKLKKESSEDLFAGLKVVDNMLNKAAGINESASLTLDQRLKKRLTESMEETSTAGMAVIEAKADPKTKIYYYEYYPHYSGTIKVASVMTLGELQALIKAGKEGNDEEYKKIKSVLEKRAKGTIYFLADIEEIKVNQILSKGTWGRMTDEGSHAFSTVSLKAAQQKVKEIEAKNMDLEEAEENSTMPEASMEEDMGATAPLDSEMEDEGMREYNYSTDNYNYQANDRGVQFGEEEDEDFLNTDKEEDPFMEDPDLLEMLLEDETDLAVEDPAMDTTADTGMDMGADATAMDAGADMTGDMGGEAPAMDDLGADAGLDAGADMTDMGADMGGAGMPTGGMDMGAGAGDAGADVAVTATADVTASPEDIDALIDGILMENEELKALGYEDLGEDDITATVKNAGNGGPKIKLETDDADADDKGGFVPFKEGSETPKSTKLATQELTGNVKGGGEVKNGDAEKATTDLDFTDAKDKDFGTTKVKDEKATALNQKAFEKVKAESAQKDKALIKLAEKFVALEEENKKLKLENYKATKVNHVLTLLPELSQKTREALVTRFSEAKDYNAVRKLYTDVQTMIKESKRPSLNEAVSKVSKSVKHIVSESTNGATAESDEQARKNFLMGIEGYDDQYFNH